ncbi:MAG: glycosyltransferase family 2 protein [Desulfobacterales bacterium]
MIDLIIVNYKSTDFLHTCLSSVYDNLNGTKVDVHVFDNASNDHVDLTEAIFPKTSLIRHHRNLGFSGGVNRVIKQTSSPYIVILNPDTIVFEDFFESVVAFMEKNPNVGILGPKVINPDHSIQGSARAFPTVLSAFFGRKSLLTRMFPNSRFASANILSNTSDGKTPIEVDWVSGACMVVKREALDDVGLLDERFFLYWEDVDWCKRMWDKGWKVTYYPQATIQHAVGGSSERNLIRSIFEFHKSAYTYFVKYVKSPKLLIKPLIIAGLSFRFIGILLLQSLRRVVLNPKPKSEPVKTYLRKLAN